MRTLVILKSPYIVPQNVESTPEIRWLLVKTPLLYTHIYVQYTERLVLAFRSHFTLECKFWKRNAGIRDSLHMQKGRCAVCRIEELLCSQSPCMSGRSVGLETRVRQEAFTYCILYSELKLDL